MSEVGACLALMGIVALAGQISVGFSAVVLGIIILAMIAVAQS